ncbi:hypothetical protein JCGZ_03123 [Jatropha curcas]|uniref:Uncharacterized protein n=1 Tax=Jatropha curcas TaxID=180498 RepID=A0A067JPL4_JATCU|nr:hypothetical protein JCGZ_03123 [Jatropha curcas]
MVHMRLGEKVGDAFRIMGTQEARLDVEGTEEAGDTNMEGDIPYTFPGFGTFSGAGMETIIFDWFQSIEIMHGSLDSRIDTMQSQYQGIANQLQTVIQLLQPHPHPHPHPPPPPEE